MVAAIFTELIVSVFPSRNVVLLYVCIVVSATPSILNYKIFKESWRVKGSQV